MAKHINIAIDGPGGAGKSTISKAVAKKLGIIYVDTGALYRTVGYYARENGLSVEDVKVSELITPLLDNISIEIKYVDGSQHVILNGEDLGDKIRQPDISMYASAVSSVPSVRAFLLEAQKELARKNSVIMDGRDIGTVVFPQAELKLFLTASPEIRAQRRHQELKSKGIAEEYESVLQNVIERDYRDTHRTESPLRQAEDAILIDNSNLTPEQQNEAVRKLFEEKIVS